MIKQDVAQFRNVIAVMMVKIYKHLTKLSTNMANFQKLPLMSKSLNMIKISQNELDLTKLTHGNIFSSQDHYKHPHATQYHVKATEPCVYFYKMRLLMVDIMQRFSTQNRPCKAYKTCESIFFQA